MIENPFTFRILAVKVLKGCKPYIQKCLRTEIMYYLCNAYRIKDINGKNEFYTIEKNHGQDEVNDDFYYISSDNKIHNDVRISISAIVGMNGDGKSSLIELIARLINNYAQYHNFDPRHSLLHVDGVSAQLFYQYNDNIFMLSENYGIEQPQLYLICNLDDNGLPKQQVKPLKVIQTDEEAKKEFFYTLVSNYSHYAYNIYDYQEEREDYPRSRYGLQANYWLNKVFHKTDGYQVPLSLNPNRDFGNIDINNESDLSKQRLLSLFVSSDNPSVNPSSFRHINGKDVNYITLEEIGYSKFQKKTLIEGLKKVRNEDRLSDEIKDLERLRKHKQLFDNELNDVNSNIINILRGARNLLIRYTLKASLFSEIRNWVKALPNKAEILPEKSDISLLLDYFKQFNIDEKSLLGKLLKRIRPFRVFNLAQLFEIHIIGTVCESYADYSKQPFDKDFTKMLLKEYTDLSSIEKCEHYIIYKILSIFETYPQYIPIQQQFQSFMDAYHKDNKLLKGHTNSFSNRANLVQLESDIKEETHITLKLRQTYKYMCDLKAHTDIYEQFRKDDKTFYVKLDDLREKYELKLRDLVNLPPAIYKWDFIFEDVDTKDKIKISKFSSGEKQRLNSLGAVLYHIRNIDSINEADNNEIKYQAINLILEEVELYFHPEWQRQYIKSLIDAIRGMKLQKVKSINIVFVTHSPFILSDIAKCNVLFLKHGKPYTNMQGNTFGANINNLLKEGFFMPTLPIGDFAYSKINALFSKLNEGIFNADELKKVRNDIMQVGEPYLRGQLLKLYKDYDMVLDNNHIMECISRIVEQKVSQQLNRND